jgi:hypothetical protein
MSATRTTGTKEIFEILTDQLSHNPVVTTPLSTLVEKKAATVAPSQVPEGFHFTRYTDNFWKAQVEEKLSHHPVALQKQLYQKKAQEFDDLSCDKEVKTLFIQAKHHAIKQLFEAYLVGKREDDHVRSAWQKFEAKDPLKSYSIYFIESLQRREKDFSISITDRKMITKMILAITNHNASLMELDSITKKLHEFPLPTPVVEPYGWDDYELEVDQDYDPALHENQPQFIRISL